MAVNVLDSKRIQITDWRPQADTKYTHSGAHTVDGETLELTGYELEDHRILSLDGASYKAVHAPTVLASTAPVASYPLTESGKYFSTPHNDAFWCPVSLTIMLRFKLVSHTGTAVLIGKGLDWDVRIDASNNLCFSDGSNGVTTSTLAITPGVWTTASVQVSGNSMSTIRFTANGAIDTQTVNPLSVRPMGTDAIQIGAYYSTPASNYVSAYWDRVCMWDDRLHDNSLDNALNYLKIQERSLILDCEFPYVSAASITDTADAYEVEM